MTSAPIRKDSAAVNVKPNLSDYEQGRAGFARDAVRGGLAGLPEGRGLNIAEADYEKVFTPGGMLRCLSARVV